jgi:hypothetical protein
MPEVPPDSTLGAAEEAPQTPATAEPAGASAGKAEWAVASHKALFDDAPASCCDACGESMPEGEGEANGYGIPGRGVYLSARGGEARLESVPLCAACASAIGMTALARWEIEEEEG